MPRKTANTDTPIQEVLWDLIEGSDLHLRQIATRASLDEAGYQSLWRWATGRGSSLKMEIAEAVYEGFTGQKFHRG